MHLQIWMRTCVHAAAHSSPHSFICSSWLPVSSCGRSSPSELHVSTTLVGILSTGETSREKPRSPPAPDAYIMMHCLPFRAHRSPSSCVFFPAFASLQTLGLSSCASITHRWLYLCVRLPVLGGTPSSRTRIRRVQSCRLLICVSQLRNPTLCVAQRDWYASMIVSLLHKSK